MIAVIDDVCEVFKCNPNEALEQDLDLVNELLSLRADKALFATPGDAMTEAMSERFDELSDAATNRTRFLARHARLSGES